MTLDMLAGVIGGVGLFLLGMRLMTDGLKVAAGEALRGILARSTRTRLRGLASGMLVTALVQSSSAVTVATIGFVNAGLLSLAQAMAVTYGSNIGTTMTGWLVAAIGFHVNIRAFALPLVGIGMALRLLTRGGRLGPLGEALAGFGLFFMGIDTLRIAFEGLGDHIELASLAGSGVGRTLLLVLIGFALTLLMQSSSAAIAIVLTAAGGGVVPLGSGAALVIGANLGTTSTAALASIGATPNARRVAAGHVAFNAVTGVVSLFLLPLLLLVIVKGRTLLNLDAEPAAVLAAFHTLFNLLGVALMLPLTGPLLHFLDGRFRSDEENEASPRYLDRNVLTMPRLAFDAMILELARVGQIARRLADAALRLDRASSEDPRARASITSGQRALAALVEDIGEYAQRLQRTTLPPELDALLPTSLRVSRYYFEASHLAGAIADERSAAASLEAGPVREDIERFVDAVRSFVARAAIEDESYGAEVLVGELENIETQYHQLKSSLLEAGSRAVLTVHELVALLDWLSNIRRLAEQIERGTRFLASLEVVGAAALKGESSEAEPVVRSSQPREIDRPAEAKTATERKDPS